MQRQRGGLVPIGDALSGMGGPMKALHDASPQARRGFTRADQVDQLVAASEANPERGFMARLMALCSLPRTKPGKAKNTFTLLGKNCRKNGAADAVQTYPRRR